MDRRPAIYAGIAVVATLCAVPAANETHWHLTTSQCVVERCIDGDTVKAYIDGSLTTCRLEGIDAPEHDQPFGTEAKEALERQLVGKNGIRAATGVVDRYGRRVTTFYVGRKDVNLWLVERGYAWHYAAYARNRDDLRRAQETAKDGKRGLWDGKPIEPWEWRKTH